VKILEKNVPSFFEGKGVQNLFLPFLSWKGLLYQFETSENCRTDWAWCITTSYQI